MHLNTSTCIRTRTRHTCVHTLAQMNIGRRHARPYAHTITHARTQARTHTHTSLEHPYLMETGSLEPTRELLATRNTTLPLIITEEARRNGPDGRGSSTALYDRRTTTVNVIRSEPMLFVALTTTVYGSVLVTAFQVMAALLTSISIPGGADGRLHVSGVVP